MGKGLQKAFNDNNTMESKNKEMAQTLNSTKNINVSEFYRLQLYEDID